MLKARWIGLLAAFVLLGFIGSLLLRLLLSPIDSFLVTLLLLLSAPALVLFARGFSQGTRNLGEFRRNLTWWHGLWLVLFLSEIFLRVRDVHDIRETAVDAEAAYRIVLVGMTALVLLVRLAFRQSAWLGSLFRGLVGAMTLYALFSATSTIWSVYPAWTLYKSGEYLVDLALLAAILGVVRSTETYKTLFDWTYTLYGLLLSSVWLGVLLWPKLALVRTPGLLPVRLYGVLALMDANTIGECAAILAVAGLTRALLRPSEESANRAWYWLLFLASFATLVLSQTRTALAGLLFALAVVLLLSRRKGAAKAFIAVGMLLPLTHAAQFLWEYVRRGQSEQLWTSLSGRVNFWRYGWEKFLDRPWTGYGAYAGRFVVLEPLGATVTSTLHNSYMEMLVGVGILGLLPVLAALLGAWWLLVRASRDPSLGPFERQMAIEAVGVLAILTVRSFFSTTLIWHPALFFLLVLGYAEFLRRQRSAEATVALQSELQTAE